MGKIQLNNLNVYSHHGCFDEETKIGSKYQVDVCVEGDFTLAENNDMLDKTVDYVELSDIIANEMKIPSKLIEHVASRILDAILARWEQVSHCTITIKKLNPPMNEYVDSVNYTLCRNQSNSK